MTISTVPFKPIARAAPELRHDERYLLQLPREQLLRLQFSKLINYYGDQLAPEWGGSFFVTGDFRHVLNGWERFADDVAASMPTLPFWINKVSRHDRWGPENLKLSVLPDQGLGYPYEPYLACNGGIMRAREAVKFFTIDLRTLVDLKLQLFVDSAVIAALLYKVLDIEFKEVREFVPQLHRERKMP